MQTKRLKLALGATVLGLGLTSNGIVAQTTDSVGARPGSASQAADIASSYKASSLMDMDVKNLQNRSLGSISELIINPSGEVTHVVLSEGVGGQSYVVPWDRVSVAPDGRVALLDSSPDQLSSEFSVFEEAVGRGADVAPVEESPEAGTPGLREQP